MSNYQDKTAAPYWPSIEIALKIIKKCGHELTEWTWGNRAKYKFIGFNVCKICNCNFCLRADYFFSNNAYAIDIRVGESLGDWKIAFLLPKDQNNKDIFRKPVLLCSRYKNFL